MNMKKSVSALAALAMLAGLAAVPVNAAEGTEINGDYTITQPGSYYIGNNLSGTLAIRNEAEGAVTLDLNGKTVTNDSE